MAVQTSTDVVPKAETSRKSRLWAQILAPCLVGALAPLVLFGFAVCRYGTIAGVQACIRGEHVYAEQPVISLTNVKPGSVHDVQFNLGNIGVRDATILDATSSCDCLRLLPSLKLIASGGHLALSARLTTSGEDKGHQVIVGRLLLDAQEEILKLRLEIDFAS